VIASRGKRQSKLGHVVPWCLGCGLLRHDRSLFDREGDPLPRIRAEAPDRFMEENLQMAVMGVE